MKTRIGFVSNSSSSSFIIGVKGKLTKQKIINSFNIDKKSLLFGVAEQIARVMLSSTLMSKKEYMEYNYYDDESELSSLEKEIYDRGFNLYKGSASDEDSYCVGELVLCNLDLDYEDDNIILYKEAGY